MEAAEIRSDPMMIVTPFDYMRPELIDEIQPILLNFTASVTSLSSLVIFHKFYELNLIVSVRLHSNRLHILSHLNDFFYCVRCTRRTQHVAQTKYADMLYEYGTKPIGSAPLMTQDLYEPMS